MKRPILVLYLALIMAIYAAAGAVDMAEEQRLSVEGYVHEHVIVAGYGDCR